MQSMFHDYLFFLIEYFRFIDKVIFIHDRIMIIVCMVISNLRV